MSNRNVVRLPPWFKIKAVTQPNYLTVRRVVREQTLNTVCQEARCPNQWECWNAKTATFMILGEVCTRSCGFCSVKTGRPVSLDYNEPIRLAEAVAQLGLQHVVITSVNRDELPDGGAEFFAMSLREIRKRIDCTIEVLIPDFQGNFMALKTVIDACPDMAAHNIETVPRLYSKVRPQAKYARSLQVLSWMKEAHLRTKTGMMLGLGESLEEVRHVMADLVEVGCNILTLGQYLQPTLSHLPVARFVPPAEFALLKQEGEAMGIPHVEAGPRVRSSYMAHRHLSVADPETRPY